MQTRHPQEYKMESNGVQQFGIAAVVTGSIQVIKPFLPKRFLPLISWGVGAILGGVYGQFMEHNLPNGIVSGIISGMAANGLYEQTTRIRRARGHEKA